MHEFGIVERILKTVRERAGERGVTKVKRVRVVLGSLAGVTAESLRLAFEALAPKEDLFRGASLEVESRQARMRCPECGSEREVEFRLPACPECGAGGLKLLSGQELYVDCFEGD
ncbi:MAG: hydrogenase maturation nickel metallochaperone HypA [Acetobacteraceae bacterium]|nr:hydrogenase maturation nickel metallochaperone HypA [Acetobacteraceae bacterium]